MKSVEQREGGEGVEPFGRYRLRGILGQGGMGRLYVAEQTESDAAGRIVAVKRILPHLADSPQFRELFLKEARVVYRLKHANIVATHEFGEIEGSYFVSMEYLAGEDLATVWERCRASKPMPVAMAMGLIDQCATGLHYLHEARDNNGRPLGLVHRDVNPANLFVTYDGVAKLLDFGIVKNNSGGNRTAPGIFKGTYGYCAPEQVVGGNVDRQTDVFCLGIVFWELLTGRRLFDDGNQVTTIDAVRSRRIEPPSAFRAGVPAEIDAIVLRALDRDRRGRFVSAHQLCGELRNLSRTLAMPPPREIGGWLQLLVGGERVALKRAIGQGTDVEGALARLTALAQPPPTFTRASSGGKSPSLVEPRTLWSTGMASRPSSSPSSSSSSSGRPTVKTPPLMAAVAGGEPPARPRRRLLVVGGAGSLAALAVVVVLGRGPAPARATAQPLTGALTIRSFPPGAQVMVDGDPSGLVTPATLPRLRAGKSVEIRVEKAGYGSVSRRIDVKAGPPTAHDFELSEATGKLVIEDLPANATVFIDDSAVEGRGPVSLSIGPHRVRVETPEELLFSAEVTVQRGEQTVRLAPSRRGP